MRDQETYYAAVIEKIDDKKIVASGTLIVESKFIHQCGSVGHVEDVVVDETDRGNQLGRRIIEQLKHIGDSRDVYKLILDCQEKNVGFYEKNGFERKGVEMAWYRK